jgi:hypothetical protein
MTEANTYVAMPAGIVRIEHGLSQQNYETDSIFILVLP